jgi:uncharacterized lipoprotein YajG
MTNLLPDRHSSVSEVRLAVKERHEAPLKSLAFLVAYIFLSACSSSISHTKRDVTATQQHPPLFSLLYSKPWSL